MSIFGNSRAVRVLWPKSGVFRRSMFSRWRSDGASKCLGVVGGQVPRLYGGTIFRGGATPSERLVGLRVQRFHFWKSLSNFFDPPNFGILTHKLAQMCNYMKSGIPLFFFFFWVWSPSYGCSKNLPFLGRQIVNLHHEGSTILMQCHLEICRGLFYLLKATFQEFLQLTVFL